MMPPKKSKAARQTEESQDPAPNATPKKQKDDPVMIDEEEEAPEVNVFKVEILDSKRDRKAPVGDSFLNDWIEKNLEEKEDVRVSQTDLYEEFVSSCSEAFAQGIEETKFRRILKSSFPKGFTVKADSPLAGTLKEIKIPKPRTKEQIKADSLKIKMRDIIEEAIRHHNNPKTGVGFNRIKVYISSNYPALQIDVRSDHLKKQILREVYYGHIYVVKGVGKAGFYRCVLTKEEEEKEKEEEAEAKKKAKDEAAEAKKAEAESKAKDEGEGDETKEGEEAKKKKVPTATLR